MNRREFAQYGLGLVGSFGFLPCILNKVVAIESEPEEFYSPNWPNAKYFKHFIESCADFHNFGLGMLNKEGRIPDCCIDDNGIKGGFDNKLIKYHIYRQIDFPIECRMTVWYTYGKEFIVEDYSKFNIKREELTKIKNNRENAFKVIESVSTESPVSKITNWGLCRISVTGNGPI